MNDEELRQRLSFILLNKLASEPYLSTTYMDNIERHLYGPVRAAYLALLLDRIESEPFPNPALVKRVALLLQ